MNSTLKCVMYIDDRIAGSPSSLQLTTKIRDVMLDDLQNAGFTVNFKKSNLTPSHREVWLGFIVDIKKNDALCT